MVFTGDGCLGGYDMGSVLPAENIVGVGSGGIGLLSYEQGRRIALRTLTGWTARS